MYDLLKTIPYTFTQTYITKDRYRVEVVEHIHYPKYSVRGETQGFKMQLSGPGIEYRYERKYLSSAKTVNIKVDELIKARQVKEQGELTIEQATQTHLTNLTLSFPDATIVAKQDYDRVRLSRSDYDYKDYQSISVTLRNGIEVKYEVLTSGALRRRSIDLTPGFTSQYPTHEELLTKLNSI